MSTTKTGPKAPTFKHDVTFCGAATEGGKACHRLPAHHGEHAAFVRGNGVAKPKPRKVTKPKASVKAATKSPGGKVITIGGTKFRVTIKGGEATITKVVEAAGPKVLLDQIVEGFRVVVFDDGTMTSTPVTVTTLPEGEPKTGRIGVTGPVGRPKDAKTGRFVTSGQPSARLA